MRDSEKCNIPHAPSPGMSGTLLSDKMSESNSPKGSENVKNKSVASVETPPLYFCCCTCLSIKMSMCLPDFDKIHQLVHMILSINIILKSIKDHNCVGKFGGIMCNVY